MRARKLLNLVVLTKQFWRDKYLSIAQHAEISDSYQYLEETSCSPLTEASFIATTTRTFWENPCPGAAVYFYMGNFSPRLVSRNSLSVSTSLLSTFKAAHTTLDEAIWDIFWQK